MNPVLDQWLDFWHYVRGGRYRRYRYTDSDRAQFELGWETTRHIAYFYRYMDYAQALDLLGKGTLKPHYRYRHFTKSKKDGSKRELVEPDDNLKEIQRVILMRYLNTETVHHAAVGFRRKKSVADHVWPHAGASLIITADIKDFFPNTKRWRILEFWENQLRSEKAAELFTILTTYHGSLPQGAPTSPSLSNLVNHRMDTALDNGTRQSGGTYTRYCDDMIFSWHGRSQPPADFKHMVTVALREFGYTLHPEKGWCVYTARDEPEITGAVLTRNGRVRVPEHIQKIMKDLRRSDDPYDLSRLEGYEGYQKMIEKRY